MSIVYFLAKTDRERAMADDFDMSDSGLNKGLTRLQRELLDRKRRGENVQLVSEPAPDGGRVVTVQSLEEVAETLPGVGDVDDTSVFEAAASAGEETEPVVDLAEAMVEAKREVEEAAQEVDEVGAPAAPEECPRCGFKRGDDVEQPTDEDKQYFVEVLLGDNKKFEKSYSFVGGNLHVHYLMPDQDTRDAGYKVLLWMEDTRKIMTRSEQQDYYVRWSVATSVEALFVGRGDDARVTEFETIKSSVPATELKPEQLEELYNGMMNRIKELGNRYPFAAQGVKRFFDLNNTLALNALNENFWTGVSLA